MPYKTTVRRIVLRSMSDGCHYTPEDVAEILESEPKNAKSILDRLADYRLVRPLRGGFYKITSTGRHFLMEEN